MGIGSQPNLIHIPELGGWYLTEHNLQTASVSDFRLMACGTISGVLAWKLLRCNFIILCQLRLML